MSYNSLHFRLLILRSAGNSSPRANGRDSIFLPLCLGSACLALSRYSLSNMTSTFPTRNNVDMTTWTTRIALRKVCLEASALLSPSLPGKFWLVNKRHTSNVTHPVIHTDRSAFPVPWPRLAHYEFGLHAVVFQIPADRRRVTAEARRPLLRATHPTGRQSGVWNRSNSPEPSEMRVRSGQSTLTTSLRTKQPRRHLAFPGYSLLHDQPITDIYTRCGLCSNDRLGYRPPPADSSSAFPAPRSVLYRRWRR